MNKLIKISALIMLVLTCFTACKKDGDQLNLLDGQFPPAALTASSTIITLSSATEADTALRFNWLEASFGPSPVVSYTLQLDVPADTSAANHWANAKNYTLGSKITKYGFVSKDLNNLLNSMNLTAGIANSIVFRLKADVNQYNGTTSTIKSVYSTVTIVKIISYGLNLYLPGDYQNWDPGSAPILPPIAGKPGMYEGYINFTGAGVHYFKFTNAPDWNHINYGDGGNGTFDTNGAAGGLSVPSPGYYEVTANLNNNTWTATKTTWGVIGDASPGGWNNDTQMTYDAASQTWKLTANMIQAGSFKFRANNQWSIDFGIDNSGKLLYADNPFLGYTANLNNLSVPVDGNYTITLDLHQSGNYSYILHKN